MNPKIKELFRYVFPTVGGLCVTYLYNIVDGIFVGQGIGPAALGAVNIGVPFITFVVAIAAMFPMGGATVVAIRMGRGDKDGANSAFMTAFTLTILMSAVLMIIGMIFPREIALISGANKLSNKMLEMATDYIFFYTLFSIPMLLSTCLSVFVRNDGSPSLAFWGMCVGAISNIFLDWFFIFPLQMGIVGAAIASGLGQVFSLVILLSHFFRKKGDLRIKRFVVNATLIRKICKRGVPEGVSQLATPATALCYNIVLANLIGDIGVSTFSVLSFIYSLANAILSGVAQGIQPLWGNSYGKRDTDELQYYFRSGLILNLSLSVIIYVALFIFDKSVIRIFNQDAFLVEMASQALPVFSLSFIPMALNLIFTALFYSTKRTIQADAVAVCRGIVIKAVAIFCIPAIWGSSAIWIAPFVAECLTLTLAVTISKASKPSYK